MTRDARSFTRKNHTKSCRLPVPRIHKLGWQETQTSQKKLLKNSATPIIIIGDSIAIGLRRYRDIQSNYFKDALNLGIGGDRVENVLWRARDISLPHTTLFVIIHCGTNNVDQSQPEDIAVGVMKIAETFMKNHPKITTIITGMLPRDKTYSFRRAKIDETKKILKAKCKNLSQTYFMDQDDDWVKGDLILDENLYYKDFLHLARTGNEKFSKTIWFFLKQFLTEFRHPSLSSPSFLCPSTYSLLSPSL